MAAIVAVLNKYWRHAALAVQETLAYRVAYILNILSGSIFYIIIFFIWSAVYGSAPSVGGFTWPEMQGYLLVSLITSSLVSTGSEFRIGRQIRTGNIAIELLRPVDYQTSSLFITLGNSLGEGVLVAVVCLLFLTFLRGPAVPRDLWAWLGFIPALMLSLTVKFLVVYVFSLACFWTNSLMGVSWLRRGLTDFFSGALIPLSFFPPWLLGLANALPFRGVVYVPAMAFIGKLSGTGLLKALGIEALWVLVLWVLAKLVWRRAMSKVCIQGG